jgi:hypothetical protein
MFDSHEARACWNYLEPICPLIDTGSPLVCLLFAVIGLALWFDVSYWIRIIGDNIVTSLRRKANPPAILATHVYRGKTSCFTFVDL